MSGVIGIDPSITATGLAHTDGRLTTAGGDASYGDQRLVRIQSAIIETVCSGWPQLAVIEDLPTHAHGAGITGMVQGVIRTALLAYAVPYVTVPAASLKKYATGRGNATKADMRVALLQRLGIDERDDNKVDAWWLRAMGCDWLGAPLAEVPKANRAALDKVAWPEAVTP